VRFLNIASPLVISDSILVVGKLLQFVSLRNGKGCVLLTPAGASFSGILSGVRKMSGQLLWRLPHRVSGRFVLSFLTLRDVVQLDRSCCSQKYRPYYLEITRYNNLAPETGTGIDVLAAVRWAANRRVKCIHLVVSHLNLELEQLIMDSPNTRVAIDLRINRDTPSIPYGREEALTSNIQCLEIETMMSCSKVPLNPALCNLKKLRVPVDTHNVRWAWQLIANNTGLTSLSVHCHLTGCEKFLSSLCPMENLLTLRLYANNIGTEAGVAGLSALCPNLSTLEILPPYGNYIWQSKAMEAAVATCLRNAHKLRVLVAPQLLTDAVLLAIAQSNSGVPHITELTMPLAIQYAATILRCTAALAHLERYEGFDSYFTRCPEHVQRLAGEHMSQLRSLTVRSSFLTVLARIPVNLRDLTVVYGPSNSVEPDLLCVIRRSPALLSLQVQRGSISGAVLHELARYCPQLHTLTAGNLCWDISAKDLQFFIQRCPGLVKLIINVTTALTDKVLLILAQQCWYLHELYINKDARVTEHGLVQLVASCKHLRVLHYRKIKAGVRRRLIALVQARGRRLTVHGP
jgi:hypothetical protein